jgi:hypothetical protein
MSRPLVNVAVAMLSLVTACSSVSTALTPEGERVVVIQTLTEVESCKDLGVVNAAMSGAASNQDTRLINGRNRAGALGGNRILAGRIELTGVQEFYVFLCP